MFFFLIPDPSSQAVYAMLLCFDRDVTCSCWEDQHGRLAVCEIPGLREKYENGNGMVCTVSVIFL